MTALTLDDVSLVSDEPRVKDLRLAEALGFERPRDIRKLIERNLAELQANGEVCSTVEQTSEAGGRPGRAYWLNEAQALLISMFSKTERAAQVRKMLIDIFMAWRRGRLLPAGVSLPAPSSAVAPDQGHHGIELKLSLEVLREVHKLWGAEAARRTWDSLGLPAVVAPPRALPVADRGEACLQHLLSWQMDPARLYLGRLIAEGLDGEPQAREELVEHGIRIAETGGEGFIIANRFGTLDKCFEGTVWQDGYHVAPLRTLKGVHPVGVLRYAGVARRGTFVPASYVDNHVFGGSDYPLTSRPN